MAALRETIIAFVEAVMAGDQLVLPYAKQGLLSEVYESARVLSEDYDGTGRIIRVRGLPGAIAKNSQCFLSSIAGRSFMTAIPGISRALNRHDATGRRSGGSPAARNKQQMGRTIHELRARGTRLLKLLKFIGKRVIA